MFTRSTFNYNGPLWLLLLGRIVDETLFLDLLASVEGPTVSRQDAGQGEKAEASQGDAPGVTPSQSAPVADHQDPKTKA